MSLEGEEKRKWDEAINEEHRKMEMHKVFQHVRVEDLPDDVKVLSSTCNMIRNLMGYTVLEQWHSTIMIRMLSSLVTGNDTDGPS